MGKVEYCVFRTESSERVINVESGSHPPVITKSIKKCQILIEKGISDTTCYNFDLSHSICPISPECNNLDK